MADYTPAQTATPVKPVDNDTADPINPIFNVRWDDLRFPFTGTRRGALSKPDFDYTNLGLLFPQDDAAEKTYIIAQMQHDWLLESSISPHVHYIQTEETKPTFVMEYRVYKNGSTPPESFTKITTADEGGSKGLLDYESGSILQIAEFPMIDMTGIDTVSAIIDIIIYREDDDVSGDVLSKEFDIHYQVDDLGSRLEYTK